METKKLFYVCAEFEKLASKKGDVWLYKNINAVQNYCNSKEYDRQVEKFDGKIVDGIISAVLDVLSKLEIETIRSEVISKIENARIFGKNKISFRPVFADGSYARAENFRFPEKRIIISWNEFSDDNYKLSVDLADIGGVIETKEKKPAYEKWKSLDAGYGHVYQGLPNEDEED